MSLGEFIIEYKYLTIPFIAWWVAQILKFILNLIMYKEFNASRLVGSGGMPSSHSSFVVSLATIIGLGEGLTSPAFALAMGFALITMYDAAGVRRSAGKQARIINRIIHSRKSELHVEEELKELIGHTPFEVLGGAALGFSLAYWFFT